MPLDAFPCAIASLPGARPSSIVLSRVMGAAMVWPPAMRSRISALTAPVRTSMTVPRNLLRALVFSMKRLIRSMSPLASRPARVRLSMNFRCSDSSARNVAIRRRARSVSCVPPPPLPPAARTTRGSPASLFMASMASQAPV
ncbi:hypothetical protein G6F24_017284 [Rhizopus arrhizus]|nr:hypothetical protein G6F24_017284 [Rhizopus arrhizus]